MNINKTVDGTHLTFKLDGRLDTVTAPELEAELKNNLDGIETLTIDLENLEYMSSAGLRILLATHKVMKKQGEMKVVRVNETIMEIFEVTGFLEILTVE